MSKRPASHQVFISYSTKDKHTAYTACSVLEDAGIKCWIAPRNINPGADWAGSITAAIQSAEICVVMVSEHSIISREVLKEITIASTRCSYIMPVRIDNAELSEAMKYHLSSYQWLEALSPPIEPQLNKLAERINELYEQGTASADPNNAASRLRQENGNERKQKLQSKYANPRRPFVGRENIFEQISQAFDSGCTAVFLCGMGGIGKSEIAKAYIERNRDKYDTCVFANYTSDLFGLFTDDTEVPVSNLYHGDGESSEAYFERKLDAIRNSSDLDTLIVIDNFNVTEDAHLHQVLELPCRFLFTSRSGFDGSGHLVIHVNEIEDIEKLKEIFTAHYRKPRNAVEDAIIEDIIRQVGYHTITVVMIASQMKASHITPEKMLDILRGAGISAQMKDRFRYGDSPNKMTAFDYIRALFDMSALSREEMDILRHLSILSQTGMDAGLFSELLQLDSFEKVNSLLERSWLRLDGDSDYVSVHPVVGEVIRYELEPNIANCMTFLKTLHERVRFAWHQTNDENKLWEDAVYAVMRTFSEPVPDALEIFTDFVVFAWIQGNYRLSESCALKLFDMCEREYGLYSVETGAMAVKVGAVYYNQSDPARADPWYEKGLELLIGSVGETHAETALAFRKVGRASYNKGEFDKSERCFSSARTAYDKLLASATTESIRHSLLNERSSSEIEHALLYLEKKDYEEAYKRMLLAFDMSKGVWNYDGTRKDMYKMLYLGIAHGANGHAAEAEEYICKALDIAIKYCSDKAIDIPQIREHLADEYIRQGRNADAIEQFKLALPVVYEAYSHNEEYIAQLEKKLHDCENR